MKGRQEVEIKSGESSLDLKGNMEIVRSEDSTSEGGKSEHKGSTEGALRFSACAAGRQMEKGASVGRKHLVFTGNKHG